MHSQKCKPKIVKRAPKIDLPECYVLIEDLVIPGEEGYSVKQESVLEILDLDDLEHGESNVEIVENEEERLIALLNVELKNKLVL